MIPGHVSVGVLGAYSRKLFDIDGKAFVEGDLVTFLDVHETCNHCFQCLVAKQTTRCTHRKVYGITYGVNDGLLGGWSEVIWLKPGLKLVRIPKELDPETFIGGGCAGRGLAGQGGARSGQAARCIEGAHRSVVVAGARRAAGLGALAARLGWRVTGGSVRPPDATAAS